MFRNYEMYNSASESLVCHIKIELKGLVLVAVFKSVIGFSIILKQAAVIV